MRVVLMLRELVVVLRLASGSELYLIPGNFHMVECIKLSEQAAVFEMNVFSKQRLATVIQSESCDILCLRDQIKVTSLADVETRIPTSEPSL
jgi:hypothetical protein